MTRLIKRGPSRCKFRGVKKGLGARVSLVSLGVLSFTVLQGSFTLLSSNAFLKQGVGRVTLRYGLEHIKDCTNVLLI